MFKKLLLKALKSLTPEEKKMVREFLEDDVVEEEETAGEDKDKVETTETDEIIDEKISESREEKKIEEEGEPLMSNEDVKNEEKVEKTETNEVDEGKTTEKEETKEEKVEETTETTEVPTEEPTAPEVQEEMPQANGVKVEDLMLKEEFEARMSALEAKFAAVVKENEDLKNKYENKDFGNFQRQGMMDKDKHANSSFDEYSKQFM